MHPATGHAPQQERVHGAKRELAGVGIVADARHVFQQPRDLRGRKIGVETQPGLVDDDLLGTYQARYTLFTLVLAVLAAIAIMVPLIARNMN